MLDGAHAPNTHPSARGSPSTQTPREIRVHVHAERDPVVLPREVVDAPRAHDQAQGQSDQRCPVRGGGVRHLAAEFLSREPQIRAIKAE
eukprot:15168556-Alexandrium_andersonii.AAC.1